MLPRALPEFHAFDYGTVIEGEVRNGRNQRVDLSTATVVRILFLRPDGTGFMHNAELGKLDNTDSSEIEGENGIIFYVVDPGDLDVEGNWHLQFFISVGGGAWYSSVVGFTVLPNLTSPGEVLSP